PNPVMRVLVKRFNRIARQPAVGDLTHAEAARFAAAGACLRAPVDGDLAVIPSVQTVKCAEPHAAIPGHQDGHYGGIRQALPDRDRRDGEATKPVEAVKRGDPNISFAVLENLLDEIAGEAVGSSKYIHPSLMNVYDPVIRRANPQTAV